MSFGSNGRWIRRVVIKKFLFVVVGLLFLALLGCGGNVGEDNSRTSEGGTGGTGLEFFGRVRVDAERTLRTSSDPRNFIVTIEQTGEQTVAESNGFFNLSSSLFNPDSRSIDIRFSNESFDGVASLPLNMTSDPENLIAIELEVTFAESTGSLRVDSVELFSRGDEESVKSIKANNKNAKKQKDETLDAIDTIENASRPTEENSANEKQSDRETPSAKEKPESSSAVAQEDAVKEEIDSSDFL